MSRRDHDAEPDVVMACCGDTPTLEVLAGVQVLLERVNSHLEVGVIDTGESIPPEFLPYVFDRFRRADASTTRRHGGLGLGLSIVKQLVELHGGSVRITSGGPGHGTTHVVTRRPRHP